jgi:uncharacterized protein (TIGR03066 family)
LEPAFLLLKGRTMRGIRLATLASVALLLAFTAAPLLAADKPKDLIVGKWEPKQLPEGVKVTIEFTKDGKITVAGKAGDKEFKGSGTYKFVDDDTMETEMEIMGMKDKSKTKIVKISKEELITRDEGKKEEEKFKRVK